MPQPSVLITGSSTGIGRAIALHLAEREWSVFAGVRKESDGEELTSESKGSLTPVIIDVADAGSIQAARAVVESHLDGGGLDGLVNNAGISVQGPLEFLRLDDLRWQLEVNVIGQVAVTQAFLPLIRKATGRIVFIGSVAGRAPSLPMIGPYAASKYAIEALAESLRLELLPWDIKVSIVEPGSIESKIWEKGDALFDDVVDKLSDEGKDRYLDAMNRARRIALAAGRRGSPADKVAQKVYQALTATTPRIHYLVGLDAKTRAFVESRIPKPLRDRVVSKAMGYDKRGA